MMVKMCVKFARLSPVFIIGFGIGFFFALLFHKTERLFERKHGKICGTSNYKRCDPSESLERPIVLDTIPFHENTKLSKKNVVLKHWMKDTWLQGSQNVSYDLWLKNQGYTIFNMDMDTLNYGPRIDHRMQKKYLLESEWLRTQVHVTCMVFVEKAKLGFSIRDTWGKRCNRLLFFGHNLVNSELPVLQFDVKITSSWQFLCEAINYLWNSTINGEKTDGDALEWVIFVKDDTMVIPENLRYMVAPLDHKDDYYMGHSVVLWGQPYNVAQAGYVLSRGALQKIVRIFDTRDKCASSGKYWKKEDYFLGKHLSHMNIYPSDTRDAFQRGTFHGYNLQTLLWGISRPGSYWTRALYPVGANCCSPRLVTFNVGEPDKMHTLNYMLYHLHVYSQEGYYGIKPAPTPIPETEVWKTALKEEFNITNLTEISGERYYEIWRAKYSEPEEFIMRTYKNMPDVLSSLLTVYESQSTTDKISPR